MPRSSALALETPLSPYQSTLLMPWPRQLQAWPHARATAGEQPSYSISSSLIIVLFPLNAP
jgi:hypothetical protein